MRQTSKWVTMLVAIFVLLSSLVGPAAAQQTTEQKAAPAPKTEQKAVEKAEKKAEPKPKAEKAGQDTGKKKFGKGEIKIAEDLAQKSGKTTDEILEMRKTGKGWGQIAQELGVKMGPQGKGDQEKPGKKAKAKAKKEKEEKKEKREKGEKKEK